MTRTETIKKMMNKANQMYENGWTRDKENAIWDIAYDWNREHEESEEIFMCEIWKDDGYDGDGFMIEDDYWIFEF